MVTNPEVGNAPEPQLYQRLIGAHPFFHTMRPEHLDILAECAREVRFKSGQVVFREGELAREFYFLQTGKVILETREYGEEPVAIQELGPGDLLGWSWLFPPFVWHFQARAIEDSTAIALDGAHLLRVAEGDHDFGFELMKRVVDVILQRLQAARKQLIAHKRLLIS